MRGPSTWRLFFMRGPKRCGNAVQSVALCAVLTAMGSVFGCDKPESTRLDEVPLPHVRAASVRLVAPRPQSRHLVPLTAYRQARLAPRSGGEVVELKVHEQQRVRDGQALVRFAADDPRGGLMSAKASIARVEESLRDKQREIATIGELVQQGAETTRTMERLETDRAVLEAQLRENQGNLVRARDRIGATSIVAPFAGTVTAIETEVGEYLAPGVVAMVLSQLDPIAIEVPLTQRDVRYADMGGLKYEVLVRGETRAPELEWIAQEALPGTSTFVARLRLANPDRHLRAGELVEVLVYGADQDAAKAVPATAIRWTATQAYVLEIDEEQRLSRIEIRVLDDTHELVVVEGDIEEGDRIVSSGPVTLVAGDTVEVVPDP